ncbi:MAG: hypothetical protein ACI4XI_05540 [Ruminococcus sp.]
MNRTIYKLEGMSSGVYKAQLILSIVIGIIGAICFFNGLQKRSFIDYLVSGSNPQKQTLLLFLGILLVIPVTGNVEEAYNVLVKQRQLNLQHYI